MRFFIPQNSPEPNLLLVCFCFISFLLGNFTNTPAFARATQYQGCSGFLPKPLPPVREGGRRSSQEACTEPKTFDNSSTTSLG